MTVVGFSWPVGHDNSVAVVVDGELVFASEEERWTRHKHSQDEPPINALKQAFKFLKSKYGIKPKEVDAYAISWSPRLIPSKMYSGWLRMTLVNALKYNYFSGFYGGLSTFGRIKVLLDTGFRYLTWRFNKDVLLTWAERLIKKAIYDLGEELPSQVKIIPVVHHLAHAASAYYFSGFGNATVLTVDGTGEFESTVVWRVRNGKFEKVISIPTYYGSLGFLYEAISKTIGYDFLEGPGKVMGLAPYGRKSKYYEKLRSYFRFDNKDYPFYITVDNSRPKVVNGNVSIYRRPYHMIAESLFPGRVPWDPRGELNKDAADLAWAVQAITEEAMLHLAKWAREHTNEQNLALAGGVALNAKANMVIHYSKLFSDMFIFPAANDAGATVGATAYVYEHVLGEKMKRQRLRTVYFGPEYGDDDIKRVVKRSKFNAEYIGDDVNAVAELVTKGGVVAWYQGRAELGPRALGNRSIIADPRRAEMWRFVNDIKGREWWRPLAPSLLVEDATKYFIDPVPHQFMILVFRYKEGMKETVPAVCHVDGTARPQTVAKDENPTWYELIKAFKDITGEGIILNTSFNLAGEPLVETPQDAIKSFALGSFDAMYIQGWLIRKR